MTAKPPQNPPKTPLKPPQNLPGKPPVILLVSPQMGENIGAAARVMANFGLSELRIVSPRDGWPNEKALSMAAHAAHIVEAAEIFEKFEDAIADIEVLYATSARPREMVKPLLTPAECTAAITEFGPERRIGLMFGPERSGLLNEHLVMADALISIPVSPEFPSINLAQSVAILAYEWSKTAQKFTIKTKHSPPAEKQAQKQDLENFFGHLETLLDARGFFKVAQKRERMVHNIRNIFTRGQLTSQEVSTLRGIIRALAQND